MPAWSLSSANGFSTFEMFLAFLRVLSDWMDYGWANIWTSQKSHGIYSKGAQFNKWKMEVGWEITQPSHCSLQKLCVIELLEGKPGKFKRLKEQEEKNNSDRTKKIDLNTYAINMLNINGDKNLKISDWLHYFKFRSNIEITMLFQQKHANDIAI